VSGTSFSSPLTASVIALMMAANPSLAPSTLVSLLESTAVDLGSAGYDQYYGYGRVNAAAAVQAAAGARTTDNQAPSVAITSPSGGSVSGNVSVNVSASDNVGVARVDLLVNGAVVATDSTSPFAFSWDSTSATGNVTLVAVAYDSAGNSAVSAAVIVNVANATTTAVADSTPPTISISNPVNGAKVTGQVTVNVTSSDNVALANVSLYIDGALTNSGNTGSISYRWNTNKIAKGAHVISGVAKDKSGNQSSVSIQVTK
jgi:hypothetical protein